MAEMKDKKTREDHILAAKEIADGQTVFLWCSDKKGKKTKVSRSWLAYTGRLQKEELSLGWLKSVHPDDRVKVKETLLKAGRDEEEIDHAYRLRDQYGKFSWVAETVMPLKNEEKAEVSLSGAGRLLSEEKGSHPSFCSQGEAVPRPAFEVDEADGKLLSVSAKEIERMPKKELTSPAWLEVMLQSIGDGVIATDSKGKVVYINPAAEKMVGIAQDAAAGSFLGEILTLYYEDTREPLKFLVEDVLESGRRVHLTDSMVLKDQKGHFLPINGSAAPLRCSNSETIGVIIAFQNRTEQKKAEKVISALSYDYEMIFHGAQANLFLVDVKEGPRFEYRRLNRAAEEFAGLKGEEIIGKTATEIFGEDIGSEADKQFARCGKTKKKHSYTAERVFPSGRRTQKVTLTPVIKEGKVIQLIGSSFDLTEQRELEKRLRDSRAQFRLLFEDLKDMACVYRFYADRPSGPVLEVNRAMREAMGYTREEILTMPLYEMDDPDYRAHYGQVKKDLVDNKEATFQMGLKAKDGRIIPGEAHCRLIEYKGQPAVLETIRDISERLEWEDKIQRRLKIEKAVSEVSTHLVRQEQADFDLIVRILGEAVTCSRAFAYVLDQEGRFGVKVAQWCAPGVNDQSGAGDRIDHHLYRWHYEQLKGKGVVNLADREDLPDSAAPEKTLYRKIKVKSVLNVAFTTREKGFHGYLGFVDEENPHHWRDEDIDLLQAVAGAVGSYFDRRDADARIRHISFHDNVTGLYNRAFFEEQLSRLDTPRQLPLSILMGDVNGLKIINDAFGHSAGDRFLKKVGETLKKVCRQEDIVARWGGDEFIILLPQTEEKEAEALADRIRFLQMEQEEEPIYVSMAIGTAEKRLETESLAGIIREAEDRMYRNKLLESQSYRSTIIASLEKTLWEKSNETEEHTRRMQKMAVFLGKAAGLSESKLNELKLLTSLHDIGKIAVPDAVLKKEGPLNPAEWEAIRRHPEVGYRIASASNELAPIAEGILNHHEHWDGRGYPQGLKGEKIPITARIIGVVDAYDVMLHDRPYRSRMTPKEAVEQLKKHAGTQFDPHLVKLFLACLQEQEEQEEQADTERED